jgi:hypothetical protein
MATLLKTDELLVSRQDPCLPIHVLGRRHARDAWSSAGSRPRE